MPFYVAPFIDEINKFIENEVPQEFARRQIDVTLFLLKRLKEETPKYTGHARNNWMMSVDSVTGKENGERYWDEDDGDWATTSSPIPEQMYRGFLADRVSVGAYNFSFKAGKSVKGFGNKGKSSTFWVFNNVRYMQALIDGHSKKAPQGWFDIVLMETSAYIDSQIFKAGKRDK